MDFETAYTQSVELLRQMIQTPSTSRDEQAVSDLLEDYMKRVSGMQVHRHNHNLWLIDPQYDAMRPTLLLNAHMDTVRPVASWQHDPFCPTLEQVTLPDGTTEERLYGLGSNDDGASLVSLLHVFLMLVNEKDSRSATGSSEKDDPLPQTRNCNLIFLASAEEEVSGRNGIESALPLLPHVDVALVGEPTGMQPAIAEKGLVVLDGIAHGKSGHAARNEGVNALYLALDAITRLRDYRFEQESPTLGPVKVTVTGIQAGTVHNVIPDTCTFMIDCRTTDAYTNEQVVETLRAQLSSLDARVPNAQCPCVELTPRSTRLQPSGIPAGHPLLRRILQLPGRQPFGSPTLSDQALMRFPSLKMGPGQSSRSHTADEYICLSEIREAIHLYYEVLHDLTL